MVTFQCVRKLGQGNFGTIFLATDPENNEEFAVKVEQYKSDEIPQLKLEFAVSLALQFEEGFALTYYYGAPVDKPNNHAVLVMDLLGPNLEEMFDLCNRRFSVKTVCMLAIQLITRMETLHSHGFVFRDSKPENFVMGLKSKGEGNIVYMVDFGLAGQLIKYGKHINFRRGNSMVGTARYMSINSHRKCEQSRRDDMEAIGHMLCYFLRGCLPWQGLKASNAESRYQRICECKINTPIEVLCAGLPEAFSVYMKYVRAMRFEECPMYDYMRGMFRAVCQKQNWPIDNVFDWDDLVLPEKSVSTPHRPTAPRLDEVKDIVKPVRGVHPVPYPNTPKHVEEESSPTGCFCFIKTKKTDKKK